MNSERMVEKVLSTVNYPKLGEDEALAYLNDGQKIIASRVLLPGLSNGAATMHTAIDAYSIDLPADYHRNLYLAQIERRDLPIMLDMRSLSSRTGPIAVNNTPPELLVVAVQAGKLIYQNVPETSVDIAISYYRKPFDMSLSGQEHLSPDGFPDNPHYDYALYHYACWQVFQAVEDGTEGKKVNTATHESEFERLVRELDMEAYREGKNWPCPSLTRTWWP